MAEHAKERKISNKTVNPNHPSFLLLPNILLLPQIISEMYIP
jgi:hypothetical protein